MCTGASLPQDVWQQIPASPLKLAGLRGSEESPAIASGVPMPSFAALGPQLRPQQHVALVRVQALSVRLQFRRQCPVREGMRLGEPWVSA